MRVEPELFVSNTTLLSGAWERGAGDTHAMGLGAAVHSTTLRWAGNAPALGGGGFFHWKPPCVGNTVSCLNPGHFIELSQGTIWVLGHHEPCAQGAALSLVLAGNSCGCPCGWDGWARGGSALTLLHPMAVKINTHGRGKTLRKPHSFSLPILYLNTIFSHSWACINFWQYNWRPAPRPYCLEELTKEIESLVSSCKYPPVTEFVCSAVCSGVMGCGTPWHQVTGGKDPLLR